MTRPASSFAMIAALAGFALAGGILPASAVESPALLGTFKDWSAYSVGTGDARTCYALARPKSTDPKTVKRGAVFFLISDWPARKVKAETEVVPGYKYKDDSKVTVQVGSDKFTFFTQNDGADGSAWVEDLASEPRLVEAMRRGAELFVTGTSSRGTLTRDTYSLGGISGALDKAHASCGM